MERASGYQIATVAKLTGVAPDTIRVWERRYALVRPARDPSGVRRYSERQVARLRLARQATALGHPIRHVSTMTDAELRRLLQAVEASAAPSVPTDAGTRGVVAAVLAAIERFDAAFAEEWLANAALFLTGEALAFEIVLPLLRAIGTRWESGALSIAHEHLASQLVRNLLGGLTRTTNARRLIGGASPPTMLFATPSGERHDFGIAVAAYLAATRGMLTCTLGADLPVVEVLRAAQRLHPRAVVIGTSRSPLDTQTATFVHALDRGLTRLAELWVGGPGLDAPPPGRWSKRARWFGSLEAFAGALS